MFYGRTQQHWQPGETIPVEQVDPIEELKTSLHEMISTMQSGITSEIGHLQQSLSLLTERVQNIEAKVASTPTTPSSVAGSSSEVEVSGGRRKRHTSLEIQVMIQKQIMMCYY